MATREARFDPIHGQSVLLELLSAADVPRYRALPSDALRDANMVALFQAEMLAAAAGVVPSIGTAQGPGVVALGAARERIMKPKGWAVPGGRRGFLDPAPLTAEQVAEVQTVYLGTQHTVRVLNANARRAKEGTPPLLPTAQTQQVATGVLIAVTAVAIAAVVAGAWYAQSTREAEVQSDKALQTARASQLAKLAGDQLAATGKIQPELVAALKGPAAAERGMGIAGPLVLVGVGIVLTAGGVALVRKLAA